jgi:uncharacterized membrane protein
MESAVEELARYVGLAIEAIAIVIVAIGSLEALLKTFSVMLKPHASNLEKRRVWLHYARWLVAALTFQLAADIVHTSVAPTWDDIGRLAAVAAIRTFLTYFLDRDMEKTRELQHAEAIEESHAGRA